MVSTKISVLVVGATGATGKHVVKQMLNLGNNVKVIARSKERMMDLLREEKDEDKTNLLDVTEASLLDLKQDELEKLTQGCDAIVQCLGHNMSFSGIFGHPRRLVTEATKRLTMAAAASHGRTGDPPKFILMGSNGVANPNGMDEVRPMSERTILFMLRYLIPPHADNEGAAEYLHSLKEQQSEANKEVKWVVVRPDDLIDDDDKISKYNLHNKPQKSLFGGGVATRANVAHFMVDLVTKDEVWKKWEYQMPVLMNIEKEEGSETKK